ncbi:MAG TPA: hypothetical protein VLJ62_05855 [Burkholderiaceae bacterium]|nr:hypothetical protein [Burkholderiaceae bacterium]
MKKRCQQLLLSALLAVSNAQAGPGAHGPNGEHLDGPAQQGGGAAAAPKLEAKSETFELVAMLSGGELSILIDKFDTNEPILGAKVEVEAGKFKAVAKFHGDHGDYAVDDPAFLQALSQPGEHALVFTIVAGDQSDLLDGTLRVATGSDGDHDHAWYESRSALLGSGAMLLLAGGAAAVAVRRRRANTMGAAR